MKVSLPSLSPFPETLLHYSNFRTVFRRSTSSGDHQFDDITCKILGSYAIKNNNLGLEKRTQVRIHRFKETLLNSQ